MDALLHTTALSIGYKGRPLLRNVQLDLQRGELVAIIGINGIGKSTLLRTLAGLQPALAGSVMLGDHSLHSLSAKERSRLVSIVLTGRPQAGMLDVRTLVSLGRQPWTGMLGTLTREDHRRIDEALEQAGASALADRGVQTLSDGECQKVLIARALAQATPLILLDEPTAFLDLTNRVHIIRLLRTITRATQCTAVFSTHDLQLAMDLCDKIIILRRDATVWQGGPAEAIEQGILAGEFDGTGVRFDPAARTFRVIQ